VDVRPRLQCRQLAIAHHEQSPHRQAVVDAFEQRPVERVVGVVAGHHRAGHGQPQGVQRAQRDLDLGQVGPVVFGVPDLEQAVRVHLAVPAGRGHVHAHIGRGGACGARARRTQVVDPQQAQHQPVLHVGPWLIVRPRPQRVRQPIIAQVFLPDLLSGAGPQRLQPPRRPRPHLAQPVVRLREHVRQPHHHRPPDAQPPPIAVRHHPTVQPTVQHLRQLHAAHLPHHQRDIIYPLRLDPQSRDV